MAQTVRVAGVNDLSPGSGTVVEAGGRRIALFNVDGTFHAIDHACSHWEGPLGEGWLEGDVVTCPWHGAQFLVTTGEACRPPAGADLRRYPVQVDGEDVLLQLG
ncbi:MAG: Rieske (2Fe-2S) protein [Planctomycetota bacterium]